MSKSEPIPASQCPHLGAEYNPFAGPHLQNPYPFFERLRKEAPVTFSPMLGAWLISRYEDINEVLRHPDSYSSAGIIASTSDLTPEAAEILGPGPIISDSPLNTDPPAHTRLRRLLQPAFLPARISRQEPLIRQIANELIDGFIHEGKVDLVPRFNTPFPMMVIFAFLGIPKQDMPQVKEWCTHLFGLLFGKVPPEVQPAMARSVVEYRRYCRALIEDRKAHPREDLTSYLVQAQPTGEALTMEEAVSLVAGSLIAAAHETTTAQLGISLKQLLEVPERWQQLKDNLALIPKAVEECSRRESVSHFMVRTAIEDVRVGNVLLPKGSRLVLLYSSANHDESQVSHPKRFELNRENAPNLTWGKGLHYCIGAQLARLELRVALEQLLSRLPDMRLVPNQDVGYQYDLPLLRNIRRLHVEWTAR
jgi:cytochrome P450